jgi:hypothetical protein
VCDFFLAAAVELSEGRKLLSGQIIAVHRDNALLSLSFSLSVNSSNVLNNAVTTIKRGYFSVAGNTHRDNELKNLMAAMKKCVFN